MPTEFHRAFHREMQDRLRDLEKREQRRTLVETSAGGGLSRSTTNLCSNDYLGLSESEELRSAVIEAVSTAPRVGGTGSRPPFWPFWGWGWLQQGLCAFDA